MSLEQEYFELPWLAGVSNFGRLVVCKQAGWRVEWVGTRDKTLRQIYCPHTADGYVRISSLHTYGDNCGIPDLQ